MGKTDTIKDRTIWIYTPTLEQKEKWEKTAQQNNTSLSKWIIKNIEDTLQESKGEIKTRDEIIRENQALKKEIAESQSKIRQLTIIRDNLEKEKRKYRAEPFLTTTTRVIKQYGCSSFLRRRINNLHRDTRYFDVKIPQFEDI